MKTKSSTKELKSISKRRSRRRRKQMEEISHTRMPNCMYVNHFALATKPITAKTNKWSSDINEIPLFQLIMVIHVPLFPLLSLSLSASLSKFFSLIQLQFSNISMSFLLLNSCLFSVVVVAVVVLVVLIKLTTHSMI